jgi:DNA-binding NarL/FixJ family response regulator
LKNVPLRCLLIDDSPEFLGSAERLLSAQGLAVVGSASSGDDGIELAQELRPDVALVDVQLGDEDGVEVARRLAAVTPAPRVILISTHTKDDLADVIDDTPAIGFIPKDWLSAEAITDLLGVGP